MNKKNQSEDKIFDKRNTVRFNIRVSQKIKSYFENKSLETGVSQSALMAIALDEYIDQKIMLEFTKKVNIIESKNKISDMEK